MRFGSKFAGFVVGLNPRLNVKLEKYNKIEVEYMEICDCWIVLPVPLFGRSVLILDFVTIILASSVFLWFHHYYMYVFVDDLGLVAWYAGL